MHQMMLLLVMVKNIPIFNIFISTFLHGVIQTLGEVASIEKIRRFIMGVIIPRPENEGKLWFITSCVFLTPVTGIKMDSTAEMYDKAAMIAFKDTITTIQAHIFNQSIQKVCKGVGSR